MALPLLVSTRFQVLLTLLAGVLFTFPSRYWFTIGRRIVFSLRRWSSQIPTGFHVSRGTWVCRPGRPAHFAYRTITVYGEPFQDSSAMGGLCNFPTRLQPHPATSRNTEYTTLAGLNAYSVWA